MQATGGGGVEILDVERKYVETPERFGTGN
jgi:hypothetical protein